MIDSGSWLHPSVILMVGALLLPLIGKGAAKKAFIVLVPVLAFIDVWQYSPQGVYGVIQFMDWKLTFGRIDKLSEIFAYVMSLMCIIGTIYSLHEEDDRQMIAAWFYVAGSLGVILAGDYLVLFLFSEIMAFSSVFLVWFRRSPKSIATGFRYLLVHTFGGLVLLAGFVLRYKATGDLSFTQLDVHNPALYTYIIMVGFMVNAAVPPLHSWLPDTYAEASVTGAVFMCAFTTKTAIYTLIRCLAGMEILIVFGVIMALYGVIYAILENDCRRLLAWSIMSQLGYMVCGVGIGTELAINGACAHAFAHILYKGLLFMGCGSVLYMTGKSKFTDLGGLYRKMPRTLVYIMVGALSMAALPFFSGFVTKSMIIAAGFEEHLYWVGFGLTMASAGTFLYVCVKLPYLMFFGETRASEETMQKAADPPWNMQLAMAIGAFFCIFIGSYTPFLYNMLPFANTFNAYTPMHISETMQVVAATALACYLLRRKLQPTAEISLDLDWFYRMAGRGFFWLAKVPLQTIDNWVGVIYRIIGLGPLMVISKFWSWFDWNAIDGTIDGSARGVRGAGGVVRRSQDGLQASIFWASAIGGVLLIAYVFS
ncbi:MAG TPA: Na(+)/H(+) antiporter subunit D [Desulfobacterales bacterium]|nr:Na(+)/H(+) antiporter subunit D [Desulfobacterales bacterium]